MSDAQAFRSAFRGFNREDVVHYIEYLNNQHAFQMNQLSAQLDAAQASLAQLAPAAARDYDLQARLEASESRCAQLEEALEAMRAQLEQAQVQREAILSRDAELEAYRRAERAERSARERVCQLYDQANSALANATGRVDSSTAELGALVDQVSENLDALHAAVAASRGVLVDVARDLAAVRPATED